MHGLSGTHFYGKWTLIYSRCKYPKTNGYKNYGGKGIIVEWDSFKSFKEDMYESYLLHLKRYGEKDTTIERINRLGNYNKKNCIWATLKEQANNKITDRIIIFDGKNYTFSDFAEQNKIPLSHVHAVLRNRKFEQEKMRTVKLGEKYYSAENKTKHICLSN